MIKVIFIVFGAYLLFMVFEIILAGLILLCDAKICRYILTYLAYGISIPFFLPITLFGWLSNVCKILTNETITTIIYPEYAKPTCLKDEIEHYNSFWKAFWHMCHKCHWKIYNIIIGDPIYL